MSWYAVGLWVVLAGGIVPAGYFTWTWRPRRRWTGTQLDAGAWVQVVLALYLVSALRGALGGVNEPTSWWTGALSLTLGVAINTVLWVRMLRWRAFKRDHPRAEGEATGQREPIPPDAAEAD